MIARPAEHPVVREFFELFKTPWEFYRSGEPYEVVLCCGPEEIPETNAKLTAIYAGHQTRWDARHGNAVATQQSGARLVSLSGIRVPVYGENVTFGGADPHSAMCVRRETGKTVARFGYNLFEEVGALLTMGQPARNAGFPALDLHIRALRDVLITSGARFPEIPPTPEGYRFIACLTHDVDHPLLRRHLFDHTMLGFLHRATVGSAVRALRGRLPLSGLLRNWLAALKLPMVHLGLATDFWRGLNRYAEFDAGAPSTFFVLPFEGRRGRNAPKRRAARYGAADISDQLRELAAAGCEVGLHGIDAWCDSSEGREELEEVRRVTRQREIGARMHWLYFGEQSPAALERAGIDYDSTVGYNETVGYRAGTAQAYKPLQTSRLLELPLHVMDTALFYPRHLNLSPEEAWERVERILDHAAEAGGCVTVNWHDRSIAPERLWGDFYARLTGELRKRGAWLTTAARVVAWFRKRRAAEFETAEDTGEFRVKLPADASCGLPGLQLRVHGPVDRPLDDGVGVVN